MTEIKTCYNCGKVFPAELFVDGICPDEDCQYDDNDVKKEDLCVDYKNYGYSLFKSKMMSRDEPVELKRDLEQVSEEMLKMFLTSPLDDVRCHYSIVCSQLRYGDGGWWERDDEVATRNWRDFDMTEENLLMQGGSIDKLVKRLLIEYWESQNHSKE